MSVYEKSNEHWVMQGLWSFALLGPNVMKYTDYLSEAQGEKWVSSFKS